EANEEYLSKLVAFDTGRDEMLGKLYCFWQMGSALAYIRQLQVHIQNEKTEDFKELGLELLASSDDQEEEIDDQVKRAEELFEQFAKAVFYEAQWNLFSDAWQRLLGELSEAVHTPEGTQIIPLFGRDMQRQLREQ